jgi:putative endonuclease
MAYMYILRCADGTFYTGSTTNLEYRMEQHDNGGGSNYTATRMPVKLEYVEKYANIADAFQREKQIQGWSHKKKQALIDQNFEKLSEL